MRYPKCRLFGCVLLLLGLALVLTGLFSHNAEAPGTPLHGLMEATEREIAQDEALSSAVTAAEEALSRLDKRVAEAVSGSEACLKNAQAMVAVEENGAYDPETDVGQLGQAILDAGRQGSDVSGLLPPFSTVYNAPLLEELSELKTTVKRAEGAAEDALGALSALKSAIQGMPGTAEAAALPALAEADTQELGETPGALRLRMRAENYLARSQTAAANAAALRTSGDALLALAESARLSHPRTGSARAMLFMRQRWLDLTVLGGLLLAISLGLLLIPARLCSWWKQPLFRHMFFFALVVALLAAALHYASGEIWDLMRQGTFDTLYMTIPATIFAYLLGLPLGVLLVITAPGHIRPNAALHNVVGFVTNLLRSVPFLIVLVLLFDITRLVMGSAIGTRAVIFPLFVSAFPYVARIVEGELNEVDRGMIEAAQSMGSNTWQIIRKVLIPEALPSLINGAAICMTTILGYTAMAGSAGGDGLGKIAITYGLNYREYDIMYISSLLLVGLVQVIQIAGGILQRGLDHRRK